MTTKDEALRLALDALEYSKSYLDELADLHGTSKRAKPGSTSWNVNRAITACREALAQKDDQEPVAYLYTLEYGQSTYDKKVSIHQLNYPFGVCGADYLAKNDEGVSYVRQTKLYTAPPQRQPLTDEKLRAMWVNYAPIVGGVLEFARAIEAAHGIGEEHEPR